MSGRGYNVWVEGQIYHTCRGSLDLAFRVTGDAPDPPEGACCYPDPTSALAYDCIVTTEDDCVNNIGGIYEGDGTKCQGIQACCLNDNTCVMADALCCLNELGGTPQGRGTQCSAPEACCMTDGTCQMLDPLCCADIGGTPQGPGTQCSAPAACCMKDGSCQMLDPLCCLNMGGTPQAGGGPCTTPEACCMQDGTCQMLDPLCCVDMGGTPQGSGTTCTSPEACCFDDGSCRDLDPLCCVDLNGTPQGTGTDCGTVTCEVLEGACCYNSPTTGYEYDCIVTTQSNCEVNLGGTYQGDGTTCAGTIEACCLSDGTCVMADPLCCQNLGGNPQGPGTTCTAAEACIVLNSHYQTSTCIMRDPLCCTDLGGFPQGPGTICTAPEACCMPDGTCQMLDPLYCVDLGGSPQGSGSDCANVQCEPMPEEPKNWYQEPDLTELGMDVNATLPFYVLADDFECTETAPIQEIHIWGSWFEDIYPISETVPPDPNGDPGNVTFHISIHADIPDGPQGWSIPGPMLADWYFGPEEFIYKQVKLNGDFEGWFNPPAEWMPIGDRNCFEYIFLFDESNWFVQDGTAGAPVVYWVDVQAIMPDGDHALFGWKTSINQWNDDAVWFDGEDIPQQLPWFEMRYPFGHPFETESVDQAFLIGGPCDCEPGEADGKPLITILDVVYIINFKYKEGPDPIPYALCSADADGNCLVSILDVVYIINYKYKNGPHPITCGNFIAGCPRGLR